MHINYFGTHGRFSIWFAILLNKIILGLISWEVLCLPKLNFEEICFKKYSKLLVLSSPQSSWWMRWLYYCGSTPKFDLQFATIWKFWWKVDYFNKVTTLEMLAITYFNFSPFWAVFKAVSRVALSGRPCTIVLLKGGSFGRSIPFLSKSVTSFFA